MIAPIPKQFNVISNFQRFMKDMDWLVNEMTICIVYSQCWRFREESGDAGPKFQKLFNADLSTHSSSFWKAYYAAIEVEPSNFLRYCVPNVVCNIEATMNLLKHLPNSEKITKIVDVNRRPNSRSSSTPSSTHELTDALNSFPLINIAVELDDDTETAVKRLASLNLQLNQKLAIALGNYKYITSLSDRKLQYTHRVINKVDSLCLLEGMLEHRDENDVAVGCGLYYETVVRNLGVFKPINNVLVANASPYFVRKWLEDDTLTNVSVTFAYKDETIVKLFNISGSVMGKANVQFVSIDELKSRRFRNNNSKFSLFVFYEPKCKYANTKHIFTDWLQHNEPRGKIILFSGTQMLENKGLCYRDNKTVFNADDVFLLPQGSNNDSTPKRKAITLFTYSSEDNFRSKSDFRLWEYRLRRNTSVNVIELLREHRAKGLLIKYGTITKENSLRSVLSHENKLARIANKSAEFQEVPVLCEFSPELPIWYSRKVVNGKLLVIACFYYPSSMNPKVITSRGKRIGATRKSVTIQNSENELMKWLTRIYPYIVYSRRFHEGKTYVNTEKRVDIRQEVGKVYDEILRKRTLKNSSNKNLGIEPISLRTLWY